MDKLLQTPSNRLYNNGKRTIVSPSPFCPNLLSWHQSWLKGNPSKVTSWQGHPPSRLKLCKTLWQNWKNKGLILWMTNWFYIKVFACFCLSGSLKLSSPYLNQRKHEKSIDSVRFIGNLYPPCQDDCDCRDAKFCVSTVLILYLRATILSCLSMSKENQHGKR